MKTLATTLVILSLISAHLIAAEPPKDVGTKGENAPVETAQDLWARIDQQRKALGDAVAANKKNDVSKLGDELKASAKSLEEKYPEANAAKKKSIHHEGKAVGRLCDDLNETVKAGQADQAGQILGRIDAVLKFLKESTAKK